MAEEVESTEVRINLRDIDDALLEGVNDSKELRQIYNDFIDDCEAVWKRVWEASGVMTKEGFHAYDTGDYIAHLKKKEIPYRKWAKKFLFEGVPVGAVYNDSPVAHFIEYGTNVDKPGGHSPWGPNTPTPEFAPMRKTWALMNDKHEVREKEE